MGTTHASTPARTRRMLGAAAAACIVALGVALPAGAQAADAHAADAHAADAHAADPGQSAQVSPSRFETPVVAGTRVTLGGNGNACTVGVVLSRKRTLWGPHDAQSLAKRYAVVPDSCTTGVGEAVDVGGRQVGTVLERYSIGDLALIRIDPLATGSASCSPGSGAHTCAAPRGYRPNAYGRVILRPGEHQVSTAIAMRYVNGRTNPQNRETFCMSGASSGINCLFSRGEIPFESAWSPLHIPRAAWNPRYALQPGDRGAPVVSIAGSFYGMATQSGAATGDPALHDLTGYINSATIMLSFPDYEIAPST
jgi:hypothetical protein